MKRTLRKLAYVLLLLAFWVVLLSPIILFEILDPIEVLR